MTGIMARSCAAAAPRAGSFAGAVGALAFANFVIVGTEFSVIGLLPTLAKDLNISLAEAGRFVTWFALAAAVVGPPLTIVAGRIAPRPVLAATGMFFALGNVVAVLLPHYSVVAAVRALQGCALPVFVSVASVAAARLAKAGREGWAVSLVNAGAVMAIVLGVPAAAWIADAHGWRAAVLVLALSGGATTGLLVLRFPHMDAAAPPSIRTEAGLLGEPRFLTHLLLSAILFAAMFTEYTYIANFLTDVAQLTGSLTGSMLLGFGFAGVLGNWAAGRVVDRDPLGATLWVAAILSIAMLATTFVGLKLPLLILLVGAWGAAHMAAFVLSQVRVMTAGSQAPAFAMAMNLSVCNAGIALGAMLGGWIAETHGVRAIGYGGAALAAAALLLAVAIRWRENEGARRARGSKLG